MHKDFVIDTYRKNDKQIREAADLILHKLDKKYPGARFEHKIGITPGQFATHQTTLRVWIEGVNISQISLP